jgi:hypothetical protein
MFRPSNRAIPDLISNPPDGSEITDERSARAELEKRLFITLATEITMESLITALLDFTIQGHSLSPMDIGIIRAIAILLYKTDHNKKAQTIATAITDLLSDPLAKLDEVTTSRRQGNDEESAQLNAAIKHVEEIADSLTSTIRTAQNTMEKLTPSLISAQTQLDTITDKALTLSRLGVTSSNHSSATIIQYNSGRPPPPISRQSCRKSIHTRTPNPT